MYHSTNVRQGPGSIELPRSRAPVVKADALLYAHFERPDLNRARDYLVDFGLIIVSQSDDELFLRGAGSTPYIYRASRGDAARFIGFGLSVSSADDLKVLAKAVTQAKAEASAAVAKEDFASAMAAMASLRPAVDAFFEKVTVNADDKALRANRLRLLNEIRAATRTVADFSKIEG